MIAAGKIIAAKMIAASFKMIRPKMTGPKMTGPEKVPALPPGTAGCDRRSSGSAAGPGEEIAAMMRSMRSAWPSCGSSRRFPGRKHREEGIRKRPPAAFFVYGRRRTDSGSLPAALQGFLLFFYDFQKISGCFLRFDFYYIYKKCAYMYIYRKIPYIYIIYARDKYAF